MIAALLVLFTAAIFPKVPDDLSGLSFCDPVPADSARPGLWKCARLSSRQSPDHTGDSVRILVRAAENGSGGIRYLEWSAERGTGAVHLPDTAFWEILDAFAGDGDWNERDPGTIGADTAAFPAAVGQAFECLGCPEPLLAGTWGPLGTSRLLIARRAHTPAKQDRLGLLPVTEISRLALTPLSSQPCREKGNGACREVRTGPGGTRWVFSRSHPDSAWDSLRVEWQSASVGDSVNLQSWRDEMSAAGFDAMMHTWLTAEVNLFAANVLGPGQAFLSISANQWRAGDLPGFLLTERVTELRTAAVIPASLLLYKDSWCRAGIDGKLRWMELKRLPSSP